MTDAIATLRRQMQAAAEAFHFEEAGRLRDVIALVEAGTSPDDAHRASEAGSMRQRPGAMGLGTGQQRVAPPPGWTPPTKPDPLTKNRASRRK